MWANIRQGVMVNLAQLERIESSEESIVGYYPDGREVVLASLEESPDRKGKMALYDRRLRAILNDGAGIADLIPETPAASERFDDRPVETRTEKPFYLPDS